MKRFLEKYCVIMGFGVGALLIVGDVKAKYTIINSPTITTKRPPNSDTAAGVDPGRRAISLPVPPPAPTPTTPVAQPCKSEDDSEACCTACGGTYMDDDVGIYCSGENSRCPWEKTPPR
jgi:hypothetical protein